MEIGDIINQYLEEASIDTNLDRLDVTTTQEQLQKRQEQIMFDLKYKKRVSL